MKFTTPQIFDLMVLVIVLLNFVLFFTTIIPSSAFLIVLSLCAIYTWFLRKKNLQG